MRFSFSLVLVLSGALSAQAAVDTAAGVSALYSPDFEARSLAVKALSAAKTPAEAAEVVEGLRKELACTAGKKPARACHAPRFVYNALLVAGNLARKYTGAPWDFLVALDRGGTAHEGSFFQDKKETDGHRGDDYFSPSVPDAKITRERLQETLEAAINKAGLQPSCSWTLARIKALARKTYDSGGYQVYSYSRDYSPAGIQGQYRVSYARDWLYRGELRAACGESTKVADLGPAGLFFASISDRSDEQFCLDISLYSLPGGAAACAYTVKGVSELDPDPLSEAAAAPAKYLPVIFSFSGGTCRPADVPGYSYTLLGGE